MLSADTSTPMGPGFFIFFQTEGITGGFKETEFNGYHPYKYRKRTKFKFAGKEEKKAAPIVEEITEKVLNTPEIETNKDIELVLRMRLKVEQIRFKNLYLKWIIQQAKKERKRRKKVKRDSEAILLLLH